MTNEEKLNIILNHKNIKNKDIVQKLNISSAFISQWKNRYSGKLNKVHLYALASSFDIPVEIFESKEFNTKEKIIEKLDSHCKISNNECIFKYKIPEKLKGRWYFYNFNSNNTLDIDIIEIDNQSVKVYNDDNKIIFQGYPIAINEYQTLIVLSNDTEPYSIQITINNESIDSKIFYASVSLKSNKNKDTLMFSLFTKELLEKIEAIEIMGEKNKNFLDINDNFLDNIEAYKINKNRALNQAENFRNIIGTWHLYAKDAKSENKIIIHPDLSVDWLKNNKYFKQGELISDKRSIVLKFKNNNNYYSDYFFFTKNYSNINLFSFFGSRYITNHNVFVLGVMSKKTLSSSDINKILSDTTEVNLTRIYRSLNSYLRKS